MKKLIIVVLVSFAFVVNVQSQTGTPGVETPVTVSPLTDKLYIVTCTAGPEMGLPLFPSNTVASVGDDGILLVDAGFTSTAEALGETVKSLGNGDLKLVINTHHHGDHTGGNHVLKKQAIVVGPMSAVGMMAGNYFNLPGPPNPDRPTMGFSDSVVFYFNGEEIRVVQFPACHTVSHACVYFTGSKVVAIGDMIFPDAIPYVDIPSGGSVKGYLEGIQSLIDYYPDDVTFIAAHGRAYSKDDMRTYLRMLTESVNVVKTAVANGRTLDEMIQDTVLRDYRAYGDQFPTTTLEMWTQTIDFEARNTKIIPSICEPLTKVLAGGTVEEAIEQYHQLWKSNPSDYNFAEAQINMLGYQLMNRQRLDDALAIFKLNVDEHPDAFNVYDSYGEALLAKGDTTASIVNYRKSLELNPDNANATKVLQQLGAIE
jgi:glyoxylase-like metal-dependent hydrolase (beta-lactamase superfamily II)